MTKKSKTLPIILAAVALVAVAVLAFVWTQRDTRRQELTEWLPTLLAFPDPGLAAAQQQMLDAVTAPAAGQPGYVGADPSAAFVQAMATLTGGRLADGLADDPGSSFYQTVVMTHLTAAAVGTRCQPGKAVVTQNTGDKNTYAYTLPVTVTQPDGTVTQGVLTGRVQYQADGGKISFLTVEGDSLQVINAVPRP